MSARTCPSPRLQDLVREESRRGACRARSEIRPRGFAARGCPSRADGKTRAAPPRASGANNTPPRRSKIARHVGERLQRHIRQRPEKATWLRRPTYETSSLANDGWAAAREWSSLRGWPVSSGSARNRYGAALLREAAPVPERWNHLEAARARRPKYEERQNEPHVAAGTDGMCSPPATSALGESRIDPHESRRRAHTRRSNARVPPPSGRSSTGLTAVGANSGATAVSSSRASSTWRAALGVRPPGGAAAARSCGSIRDSPRALVAGATHAHPSRSDVCSFGAPSYFWATSASGFPS